MDRYIYRNQKSYQVILIQNMVQRRLYQMYLWWAVFLWSRFWINDKNAMRPNDSQKIAIMHTEICSSLILSFWTFIFLKVQRFLQRICRLVSMLFWLGFHGRIGLWSERQGPRQTNSRVLSQGTKNETRQLISGSFLPDAVILIIWANLLNPVIIFDRVLTDLGSGGFEKK